MDVAHNRPQVYYPDLLQWQSFKFQGFNEIDACVSLLPNVMGVVPRSLPTSDLEAYDAPYFNQPISRSGEKKIEASLAVIWVPELVI